MPPRKHDIQVGAQFGRLSVTQIFLDQRGSKPTYYAIANCLCGGTTTARLGDLRRGHAVSCGCYRRERAAKLHRTHGETGTFLFELWGAMKERCAKPADRNYRLRGITVWPAWERSFEIFKKYVEAHLGPRPSPIHSLDRINNDKGYRPGNLRWATPLEQQRNRQTTVFLAVNGERLSAQEWGKRTGIQWTTIVQRKFRGWTDEQAVKNGLREWVRKPGSKLGCAGSGGPPPKVFLTYADETQPMKVWAARTGIPLSTIWRRKFKLGWPDDQILTTPTDRNVK